MILSCCLSSRVVTAMAAMMQHQLSISFPITHTPDANAAVPYPKEKTVASFFFRKVLAKEELIFCPGKDSGLVMKKIKI